MKDQVEKIVNFIGEVQDQFEDHIGHEVKDWVLIKSIISFFIKNDEGSPIVDFIDEYNWDSVESFSFNDDCRHLELVWHEFNHIPDSELDDITKFVFGGDTIKCFIKIDSVVIASNKNVPVLLIKPYYNNIKDINNEFNSGCSDIKISKHRFFLVEVARIVKKKIERVSIPNINNFTVSIVPNCARFISVSDSKKLLYDFNIQVANDRCLALLKELAEVGEHDHEEIETKGNNARKCFESALKVINLRNGKDFEKDYQKLMLGDLISVIGPQSFEGALGLKKQDIVDILNKCSHDSGVPVTRDEVCKAILYIVGVINLS